jgi:hypothetical protein
MDIRHIPQYTRALRANGCSFVQLVDSRLVSALSSIVTFGSLRPNTMLIRKQTAIGVGTRVGLKDCRGEGGKAVGEAPRFGVVSRICEDKNGKDWLLVALEDPFELAKPRRTIRVANVLVSVGFSSWEDIPHGEAAALLLVDESRGSLPDTINFEDLSFGSKGWCWKA